MRTIYNEAPQRILSFEQRRFSQASPFTALVWPGLGAMPPPKPTLATTAWIKVMGFSNVCLGESHPTPGTVGSEHTHHWLS